MSRIPKAVLKLPIAVVLTHNRNRIRTRGMDDARTSTTRTRGGLPDPTWVYDNTVTFDQAWICLGGDV